MLVERADGAFGREAARDEVAAGAASGEAFAAEEREGAAALARRRVRVREDEPQGVAVGAAHAARDGAAGRADADEEKGRTLAHLKNLPRSPSRMDFSS